MPQAPRRLGAFPAVVIVRLRNMIALDATRLYALEVFAKPLRESDRTLLLCGAREQPAKLLQRADLMEHIGSENILPHVDAALQPAREINSAFGGVGQEMPDDFQPLSSEELLAGEIFGTR